MPKTSIYVLMTSILILLIMFSSTASGSLSANVVLTSSGTIIAHTSGTYSYTLEINSGIYDVVNSAGTVVYSISDTDANTATAFAEACTYANNLGTYALYVASGTYTTTSIIAIEHVSDMTITFSPNSLITIPATTEINIFDLWYDTSIIFNGVNINGNAANQPQASNSWGDGITIYSCTGMVVENSNVDYCRRYGIETVNNAPDTIKNNTCIFNGWNGITLGGLGDICFNNTIEYSSDVGISVQPSDTGAVVTNNYIYDLNGTTGGGGDASWGIASEGAVNAIVVGNTIEDVNIGVVTDGTAQSCYVAYNTITNVCCGIASWGDLGYNVITQNTITNWGWSAKSAEVSSGIASYDAPPNNIISYNTLVSASSSSSIGAAIFVVTSNNCSICDNIITMVLASDQAGIYLKSTSNYNIVEGNNVQAYIGIQIASGCTDNKINGNILTACTTQISNSGTGTIINPSSSSTYTLTLNNPSLASVTPAIGTYSGSSGTQVTITLSPTTGYTLNIDGSNVTLTSGTYTLTMSQDYFVYALP